MQSFQHFSISAFQQWQHVGAVSCCWARPGPLRRSQQCFQHMAIHAAVQFTHEIGQAHDRETGMANIPANCTRRGVHSRAESHASRSEATEHFSDVEWLGADW